jgi:hypothetical protein
MKAYGNRVCVSRDDVADFRSQWPCSGLPDKAMWFEFESNGDLVDVGPMDTSRFDGPDLLALSQNAQEYLESLRKGRRP